jgi:dipeptidyl aminopeptidase/acylaminoacyl peptidase
MQMNADGTKKRFLADGGSANWSPDGSRIAYLAPGELSGRQIFVRWMDAEGATTQVTRVTETPTSLRWSPDGKWIAFLMLVPDPERWAIDMPAAPDGARWTAPPHIVRKVHYRQDRVGFQQEGYTHLFIVPADGGTPRQLTHGEWNVGARFSGIFFGAEIDWTPDGRHIVIDGNMADDADTRYRESHIYAVTVETGEITPLTTRRGPWQRPLVSPDGEWIAFTGYDWTAQTYKTTELFVMRPDGSDVRRISGTLDRDPADITWDHDSRGLYFTAGDRGSSNVHYAPLDGTVREVTAGTHMLSLSSLGASGTAVGTRTSPHEPTDIVRYDLNSPGRFDRLTQSNDDVLTNKRLGEVEEVWYTSSGGARIQGWVVKPPSFDPGQEYPLILHIHGGPHSMYNVGFNYAFQNFAANGYVVLYTNPRGSTGYGTDFGNAIDNGYPSVDYDDLMAGVDDVVRRGYVDQQRMYVTGCSGGGVLSSWMIGHTDRFAAAAVRCPVINWISFAGTADITVWGYYRYAGYPWENPTKWLEHSPLMHVGKVKTPTLLMTGELDLRTPMGQTEEYYQALHAVGVPTAMLRFNNEYHGTGSMPSNFMRTQLYIMSWFQNYTKAEPAAASED